MSSDNAQAVVDDLGFLAFVWDAERDPMGWGRPDCVAAMCDAGILRAPSEPFEPYRMRPGCFGGSALGHPLQDLARQWHQAGMLPAWRDEAFDIYSPGHRLPRFALERVAARHLGLWTEAVHMNVVLRDGSAMWLARRAAHKDTDPGMLDNLVAGGVSHGEDPWQTLLRESWEEAGLQLATSSASPAPFGVSKEFRPVPVRTVQILALEGTPEQPYLRRERLYAFQLEVDPDFRPANQDGEVSEHLLVDRRQLAAAIREGQLTKDAARIARLWL